MTDPDDPEWWDWHYRRHAGECLIPKEDKFLECEICSGIPPWKWTDHRTHSIEIRPSEYFHGCKRKYAILYMAFGWRRHRTWGSSSFPHETCRVCGTFSKVARHKIHGYRGGIAGGYHEYRDQCICLKCVREENRSESRKDQLAEVNRLLKQLKKGA